MKIRSDDRFCSAINSLSDTLIRTNKQMNGIQYKLVSKRLTQYLLDGKFLAPLVGPLSRSPPKCEMQSLEQSSIPVQNLSQICIAVLEEMHPEQTDGDNSKLNIPPLPYFGILCAWTTTQMPRGSC